MALKSGTKAPDFSLPTSGNPGVKASLKDAKGYKLVLLFFPFAFTSVCTDELCKASQEISKFRKLSAEILGISVDSPFALDAWKKAEDISIPLLSDFNRTAIEAYEVKRDKLGELENVANRAAFVIDEEGVIRFSWESDDPSVLPPFDEIREVVESI